MYTINGNPLYWTAKFNAFFAWAKLKIPPTFLAIRYEDVSQHTFWKVLDGCHGFNNRKLPLKFKILLPSIRVHVAVLVHMHDIVSWYHASTLSKSFSLTSSISRILSATLDSLSPYIGMSKQCILCVSKYRVTGWWYYDYRLFQTQWLTSLIFNRKGTSNVLCTNYMYKFMIYFQFLFQQICWLTLWKCATGMRASLVFRCNSSLRISYKDSNIGQ